MRCFWLSFFLLFALPSWAQRYSFVEYSTESGLPQSQVRAIAQDQEGYLWVGTLGGLAKFNGKEFRSYTREDGLANNKIISLAYLKNTLWIGHEGGVSCYKNGQFQNWSLPFDSKNIQVTQFLLFKEKIIVATNGAGLFEISGKKLKPILFKGEGTERIRDLLRYNGKYYVATRNGVYVTMNFKYFELLQQTKEWTVSDLEIYKGQLAVTSFQDGIYLFHSQNKSFTRIPVDPELFLASSFADHAGNLWIAAAEGIVKYDGRQIELINDQKGMPLVGLNRVFQDDEKNIWIGSDGKGLILFSGEEFVHHNLSTGLLSDLVMDINQDYKGQFWISTLNKGLVLQKKNGEFISVYDRILTFWCSTMQIDGYNWFGTDMGLLAFKDVQLKHTFTSENGLLGDKITALFPISKSSMYIGGSSGLMLYSKGEIKVIHDNEKQDIGTIRDISEYNKHIYLATDKGLYQLIGKRVVNVDKFSKTTFCLKKDEKGNFWLGTEEGLYTLLNGKIVNRNISTETASKFINFLNYQNGKVFIGTNNGLYSFAPGENAKVSEIEHFGIQEGVVNLETNLNSSFVDKKGNLWFGTSSGLVIYQRNQSKLATTHPRLLLVNVLLNYEKTGFNWQDFESGFSFPYSQNNVSFEFDGISFTSPKELKYQFWLEGGEENWSPPSLNPIVNFTSLPAGEYILHARAVGPQENYSKEISLVFAIRAPFYQTWWFMALCAIFIAGLIYLFVRIRIQREREKSEKETVVIKNKLLSLEQQSLNASMNRHFIFNSLNSIQYFINTQDKVSANKYLTNFAQLIRKNLDSSTSEGNLTSFAKEIERLKLYLSLEAMRFQDRFAYHFDLKVPESENILIPAMLLQPYIENCIVHGILPQKENKGEIRITAWTDNHILQVRIEDNGIGISKSLNTKKNFDGDHKSQGMEITSKRISLIKEMSNQSFEIIGPEDRLDENRKINGTYVLLKIPYEDFGN